jgi:hypothetical protein
VYLTVVTMLQVYDRRAPRGKIVAADGRALRQGLGHGCHHDGTNMAGKKEARSLHAMLLRILSTGRACQDPDFIMPLSLHDCGESGETNRATPSSSYLALHALCSPRIAFLPPVPSAPPAPYCVIVCHRLYDIVSA